MARKNFLGETHVKYPNIKVKLSGTDSNAFALLGRMRSALRKNDVSISECDKFFKEATSGDYDHLLSTCMKWVNVS